MSSRNEQSQKPSGLDIIKKRMIEATAIGAIGLTAFGCASPRDNATAEQKPQPVATALAERPNDETAESIKLTNEEIDGLKLPVIGYFNEKSSEVVSNPNLVKNVTKVGALEFRNIDSGHSEAWFSTEKLKDQNETVILASGFINPGQELSTDPNARRVDYHGVAFANDEAEVSPLETVSPDLISRVVNGDNVKVYAIFFDSEVEGNGYSDRTVLAFKDNEVSGMRGEKSIVGSDNIADAVEASRKYFETKDSPSN